MKSTENFSLKNLRARLMLVRQKCDVLNNDTEIDHEHILYEKKSSSQTRSVEPLISFAHLNIESIDTCDNSRYMNADTATNSPPSTPLNF